MRKTLFGQPLADPFILICLNMNLHQAQAEESYGKESVDIIPESDSLQNLLNNIRTFDMITK